MRFFREFGHEVMALLNQVVELPAWVWVPLYTLAVGLLAAIALGLHP
jgi:hypothetical protein